MDSGEKYDCVQVSQTSELNKFYNGKISFTPQKFADFINENDGEEGEGAQIITVSMPSEYKLSDFHAIKFFQQNNGLDYYEKQRKLSISKEKERDKYNSNFHGYKGETIEKVC